MTAKDNAWKWGALAIVLWLSLPLLLIDITVASFVVPTLVDGWKKQGLTSAPFPWQLVADLADFSKMHWIVFPLLLIGALVASFLALGQGARQLWQARKQKQ